MSENSYLKWLSQTESFWWNDSAVYGDMDEAIANGATGVTTNPLLIKRSLYGNPGFWREYLKDIPRDLTPAEKAEEIIRCVTSAIAAKFLPIFKESRGKQGFVCAQVNPSFQGDADKMFVMAKRLNQWADNIAIKLPATEAGVEVMEECAALGMTTVGTVSFSTPQALEIARRQTRGARRAESAGVTPGQAFSVIMVGRQDDYLRDVVHDGKYDIPEEEITRAGTAVIKRAYEIANSEGYVSHLMPAGMRGAYHTTELAGAAMSMSISANIQSALARETMPYAERISEPVPKDVIERLKTVPEFVRAYEPDGMKVSDFITYGLSQRTLSQFVEAGWGPIQEYEL
jgi:transaldolase